ncbi:MAG: phosphoribosylformylglycinamidine synthase [Gemmatimonadetes bacterium]|nr:phosphoribosylformylglycinamidine synthase [Gemmatimonadota bacterium]MBT7860492.1 phosphoribosylformylglycinamidine synthase [Gemmatimonadota bacterium]
MPLLSFAGPDALSAFRLEALYARCRARVSSIDGLTAHYVYLVHVASVEGDSVDDTLISRLESILGAPYQPLSPDAARLLVTPRPGTTSPWSTKATDILRNCRLDEVERVERATVYHFTGDRLDTGSLSSLADLLHDRMTQAIIDEPEVLFHHVEPRRLQTIPVSAQGRAALERANRDMGLALADDEVDYLFEAYATQLQRDPTDVELVMFANVNSEHCRHKIFNADWVIDGTAREHSLFGMIRNTHAAHPEHTVIAYSDNSGVIAGHAAEVFRPDGEGFSYHFREQATHIICKVETHNHPTAISPFPGASTGVGGEIRDEGATGRGAHSQAGLCAFYVSHLRLPEALQPWETPVADHPTRLATPLEIMTEAPLGGAGFGNEFGRPNLLGVFRTFEQIVDGNHRGYHKPIMVAGGAGLIDAELVDKQAPRPGDAVIQIGGPAMLIGLGGGYASSMDTGSNLAELDFASVQRENPEMERRCQELISRCVEQGPNNPIRSIHDVGAGGLSNACPELVEDAGAIFDLRAVHNDEPGMSPMEIWSNEAQERYVLIVSADDLPRFEQMATRERCLYALVGTVTDDGRMTLRDSLLDGPEPVEDLPLDVILGKPPKMLRDVQTPEPADLPVDRSDIDIADAIDRVLRFPAVADKSFLITITDRTVTGQVARDQMVGPWQIPVADAAVMTTGFRATTGSAMAMGERTPVAVTDGPASGRLAIAESVTNLAGVPIGEIERIKLSANWMCACGEDAEDVTLFNTVEAVGMDFCPELGVSIPVGKDSLSMRTLWEDGQGRPHTVTAPMSLVVSAFAAVTDVRDVVTPELKPEAGTQLLLIDLGRGRNRLGASCLDQVFERHGSDVPDVEAADVRNLFALVQTLLHEGHLLACHDRSDGGLLTTITEMAFAGRQGVEIHLSSDDPLAELFAEEIGVVLQIRDEASNAIDTIIAKHGLTDLCRRVARVDGSLDALQINDAEGRQIYHRSLADLQRAWSELTWHMQSRRDEPTSATEQYDAILDRDDPGLTLTAPFEFGITRSKSDLRPRVAILREQGVNGQVEMAAAFTEAGCDAVDVTMTDLMDARADLSDFVGLAACGGFSYGDVLGAGAGWARSVLHHPRLRDMFGAFFERPETFSLGVCNGCQMFSLLAELIPGTAGWPRFLRNRSEQFEARLSTVNIEANSNSVLLRDMAGARLPVPVAHGEGRAQFTDPGDAERLMASGQIALRYVDNHGAIAQQHPANPNGSPAGITAVTNADGRVTIMMPHPERVFRNLQLSWAPSDWGNKSFSPWLRMFENGRDFVLQS